MSNFKTESSLIQAKCQNQWISHCLAFLNNEISMLWHDLHTFFVPRNVSWLSNKINILPNVKFSPYCSPPARVPLTLSMTLCNYYWMNITHARISDSFYIEIFLIKSLTFADSVTKFDHRTLQNAHLHAMLQKMYLIFNLILFIT